MVLATAFGWGVGWPMTKIALQDWPPLFVRGTAGMAAAVGLGLIALLRGEDLLPPVRLLPRLALSSLINVFAWAGFTALSLLWLHVAEAALLTFSMPLWTTLLAWPLLGERPTSRGLLALLLGFGGLVLLMGVHPEDLAQRLPGVAFALSAAILFALGAITARRPLPLSPIVSTAWQIVFGCVPMIVIDCILSTPDLGALSLEGAGAMVYMAVGPMALCYFGWFGALKRVPATTAATGLLLVPVIGAASAAAILGEPLGLREAGAFLLTLSGVALALRGRR